ncbi:MAG: hypothetical protein COB02_03830 [Candidatus Cloacimonadota bacterium]|nr:MAG: hypothetical protein COB02_03830 [Candidatus Cloacimonadota bacterium]
MSKPQVLFYESESSILQKIKNNTQEFQNIQFFNNLDLIQKEIDTSDSPLFIFLDMKDKVLTSQWIQSLLQKNNPIEVILLNSSSHHNSLIDMMEIGVSHFLPIGYSSSQIKLLIQQLSKKYSAEPQEIKINYSDRTRGDILIVDDESILLEVLGDFLEAFSFFVNTIEDPTQVLEAIQTKKYEVVLMDINMPNMSGIEVCKQIKAYDPSIFIVGMTGSANDDEVNQLLDAGAFTCLKKPFEMKKFQKILDKLVFISHDEKLKQGPEVDHYEEKKSPFSTTTKYVFYTTLITILLFTISEQLFKEKENLNLKPIQKRELIYNMINQQQPDLDSLKQQLLNR